MHVLLVEDDTILADGLIRSLKQSDFTVDWSRDGGEAKAILRTYDFDLVILDLTLPKLDGLDLLRDLRHQRKQTPVLIITARSEVSDRIHGLDMGADDYLTKPFQLREFEARVRALIRRSHGSGLQQLSCGRLTLDLSARRAFIDSDPLNLPRREFHILEVLMAGQGHILNKEQIIDHISDFDDELNPSAVETYISRLRKKLEPAGVGIRVVRGIGYTLE
ncbi:MAG: response regulator transcription factor [Gammaproteobacteria bacterium]|nr:response regulator transcription factor [Gammaproteobacteria bacterium]